MKTKTNKAFSLKCQIMFANELKVSFIKSGIQEYFIFIFLFLFYITINMLC